LAPRTIHDFYGFPRELYDQRYPAPGAPDLAARICELAPQVAPTAEWGLDHGAWAVLASLFPEADVPVCQLSLARDLEPAAQLDLARALAPLREEGVLLLASGNIVHNLRHLSEGNAPNWALEFDRYVADALLAGDLAALLEPWRAGPCAQLAVPTPEHYLPLLYALGFRRPEEPLQWIVEGFDLASLSMRSFMFSGLEEA
jgi:4,5-DOPA dioxygenase extradiol